MNVESDVSITNEHGIKNVMNLGEMECVCVIGRKCGEFLTVI